MSIYLAVPILHLDLHGAGGGGRQAVVGASEPCMGDSRKSLVRRTPGMAPGGQGKRKIRGLGNAQRVWTGSQQGEILDQGTLFRSQNDSGAR